ncbi:BppU family phage baseplate upper protein [Bacillus pacificus]|uniref:BppU family phage baseplate upper protein n=1 Tax=Bacillus pacificus TaxID=2026187 RepID=UPI00224E8543|nr:BppU family phage baseplate upper protein [Bacillus pacificus]MCX3302015.1 BppU family phage baseplate upper protein [Bacillus pacificus]MCX3329681.1 BppU family phage baseplate upper protein [Bacillus pacificus]
MTFKTHEIDVDLVNQISTKEIRFSSGDRNSAKLILNIKNEGEILDLSKAKAVRITFKKQDGKIVFQEDLNPINAMEGKYQSILKTQTLAAAGNVYGQVRIFEEDRELDAEPFVFTVKQSYSGDEAVESTNEFTIIQKAIEAGEKLDGVDIDGIIAAGAKADAALPKTGGTMKGTTIFEAGDLRFKNAANDILFRNNTSGIFSLYDIAQNQVVWTYNPDTKEFTVNSASNLLKKTGDTMTGNLMLDVSSANKYFGWRRGDGKTHYIYGGEDIVALYSEVAKTTKIPWKYIPSTEKFEVLAPNTNLLKNTGDTMTGTLTMSAENAEINFKNDKSEVAFQKTNAGNIAMWDRKNQKTVWLYVPESNEFRLQATKSNIVTSDKDGRATITLPPEAELTSSDGVIADRKSNTVTLRARIRRKSDQISTVFVMPSDMRPLLTVTHNIIANDGTVGALSIGTSGDVKISSVGPSLLNKDFNFTITYVAAG